MRIVWVRPPIRPHPRGPANADALLLLRIAAQEPLQVLQIPTELGVQLPGEENPGRLAQLWRRGGVSLLSDAIRDIVGLQEGDPKRYVVVPRAAYAAWWMVWASGGGAERVLQAPRQDSGLHRPAPGRVDRRLNGAQAEQLVRHLPDPKAENDPKRRQRQNILVEGLIEQVKDPSGIGMIPGLVNQLNLELETNLSRSEQLSLAAALIASPEPARISRLPLADRAGEQTLRQIEAGASRPLWPQP